MIQEVKAFCDGEQMQGLLFRVSRVLGLDYNLTFGKFLI